MHAVKYVSNSGVCYGYSVMESAESVNIPFTIMRRRLMEGKYVLSIYFLVYICIDFSMHTVVPCSKM